MEQEKRPNVTARERYVGKYNEATGQFDLVERSPYQVAMRKLDEYWESQPQSVKPEDPDHAVIRKHWESMGNP